AVASGDKDAALVALKDANKNFHSFVSKGFLKKETASRKVSRLAKLVSTLAA
ncbi:30S ribosomal protein S20, partial [Helicobacter bizzozeronii]